MRRSLSWVLLLASCAAEPDEAPGEEGPEVGLFPDRTPRQCELLDDYSAATELQDAGTTTSSHLIVDLWVARKCSRVEMSLCWAKRPDEDGHAVAQLWLVANTSRNEAVALRRRHAIMSSYSTMRDPCPATLESAQFDVESIAASMAFHGELLRLDLAGFDRELWVSRPSGERVVSPFEVPTMRNRGNLGN